MQRRDGRPLLLAETRHGDSGRGDWIDAMASAVALARQHGADGRGRCLDPAIDRPDWKRPDQWHRSGWWQVEPAGHQPLHRVLNAP